MRWQCRKSGYIYDPRAGDPAGGVLPGTPFERVSEEWRCPLCNASKRAFFPLPPERGADAPPPAPASPPAEPAPRPASPTGSRSASAPAPQAPMWTVGSLKGLRQGHDKA